MEISPLDELTSRILYLFADEVRLIFQSYAYAICVEYLHSIMLKSYIIPLFWDKKTERCFVFSSHTALR